MMVRDNYYILARKLRTISFPYNLIIFLRFLEWVSFCTLEKEHNIFEQHFFLFF